MAGRKRVIGKLGGRDPGGLLGRGEPGRAGIRGQGGNEGVQGHPVAGVVVDDRVERFEAVHLPAGLLDDLAPGRGQRGFVLLQAAAGELPQSPPDVVGQPLLDEEAVAPAEDHAGHDDVDALVPGRGQGAELHRVAAQGGAVGLHRAGRAVGPPRGAHERAQLHQSLVVVAGQVAVEQGLGQGVNALAGGGFLERPVDVGQAGEQPLHVGVHQRPGLVEGDGEDGRGGVRADAGQGEQLVAVGRDLAVVALDQQPGGTLDVARPAVVAEALPGLEQGLLGGNGHRGRVREAVQPAPEILGHPLHLGLLAHDLGDPHLVGLVAASPGQGPVVGGKPAVQVLLKVEDSGLVGVGKHGGYPVRSACGRMSGEQAIRGGRVAWPPVAVKSSSSVPACSARW